MDEPIGNNFRKFYEGRSKRGIFINNDVAYSKVSKKHAPRFILFQEFFLPTWPY